MNTIIHTKKKNHFIQPFRVSSQVGVTLIESVVALLIFSLGALGLAAMQLTSLSSSGDSKQRSTVIWKAQEFVDRLTANKSISDGYVTSIGNATFDTIGLDTAAGRLDCSDFTRPTGTKFCADGQAGSAAASCDADVDKINYDIWDVFCNGESGLSSTEAGSVNTTGVTDLEVALKQNTIAVNGDNDYLLAFEWLSRETENNANLLNTQVFSTSLCGEPAQDIASNLDVYCVRIRL